MNLTLPTKSTRAWERLRDGTTAKLDAAIPAENRKALADRASVPTIQYQRYRKNGRTRIRKAAAIAEEMKRRHGE